MIINDALQYVIEYEALIETRNEPLSEVNVFISQPIINKHLLKYFAV